MRNIRSLFIFLFSLLSVACTEGIPNFDDLGKSLNPPQFSKADLIYEISSLEQGLLFEGKCDRRGKSVKFAHRKSDHWAAMEMIEGLGGSPKCQEEMFQFEIPRVGNLLEMTGTTGEEALLGFRFQGGLFQPVETWVTIRFVGNPTLERSLQVVLVSENPHSDNSLAQVKVVANEPLNESLNFELSTEDITAIAETHYASLSQSLQLPAGEIESELIQIPIFTASVFYSILDFQVQLSTLDELPSGIHLESDRLEVEISNRSKAPWVNISSPEDDSSSSSSELTVTGVCTLEGLDEVLLFLNGLQIGSSECKANPEPGIDPSPYGQFSASVVLELSGTNLIRAEQNWEALTGSSEVAVSFDPLSDPPEPASSLAWLESEPLTDNPNPIATWVKSDSAGVSGQRIRFYSDPSCSNPVTEPFSMDPSVEQWTFYSLNDGLYHFQITTLSSAAPSTPSECSPGLEIIAGSSRSSPMVIVADPGLNPNGSLTLSLPLNGTVNVQIDWGDSFANDNCPQNVSDPGFVSCTYAQAGTVEVRVFGNLTWFGGSGQNPDGAALLRVDSWGSLGLTSLRGAFRGAVNLTAVPEPPKSVRNLSSMFHRAESFNQPIGHWDVSQVTAMDYMFFIASSFNQNIEGWDVSQVTNMAFMFYGAQSFNQPLNSWDVGKVITMNYMFRGAHQFNQPLDNWNVSKVRKMQQVFLNAYSFNQPLNNWDVGSVTDMRQMFSGASSFNQPLDNWDVRKVNNMTSMFRNASSFNQDLSGWNVESLAVEPTDFSLGSALTPEHLPIWPPGQ